MSLTSEGLETKRYPEVIDALKALGRKYISETLTIDDDQLLGQIFKTVSEQQVLSYQMLELVYSGFNIKEAYGVQLDNIGIIKNITRNKASATQGYQLFSGDINTVIPAGMIVENTETTDRYNTVSPFTISNLSLVGATLSVDTVADSTDYTITISGNVYTINSGSSATEGSILAALQAEIAGDVESEIIATVDSGTLVLSSPSYTSFSVIITSNLSLDKGTVLGYVYADTTGPGNSELGVVTKIVTPLLGLDSTTNPYSYTSGADRETDEDYRARLLSPGLVGGNATIPAIRAKVNTVQGVSYVFVEHNNTDIDGVELPAKSVRVIVEGGTNDDVAEAIFAAIGASVKTYGSIIEVVVDDGQSHDIKFSRPTGAFYAVRVQYESYDEESSSEELELTIRQAVVDSVNALGIGVDLIPTRIIPDIYSATSGVGKVIVEIESIPFSGSAPTGVWSEDTAVIGSTQFAQTALVDVIVQEI